VLASIVGWQLLPSVALLAELPFTFWLWFLVTMLVSLPLGWMLGALCVWPFVAVVASKLNGAPFQEGDAVRVLAGPHRDRVLEVYTIWHERHQVRAWLDEEHKKDVTDVFNYHEVCREPKPATPRDESAAASERPATQSDVSGGGRWGDRRHHASMIALARSRRSRAGYTVFDLMVVITGFAVGAWVSNCFEGAARVWMFWVSSFAFAIILWCFIFMWLLPLLARHKKARTHPDER